MEELLLDGTPQEVIGIKPLPMGYIETLEVGII